MFFFKRIFSFGILLYLFNACSIQNISQLSDPRNKDFLSASILSLVLNEFPYTVNPSPGVLNTFPSEILLTSLSRNRDISLSKVTMTLNDLDFADFNFEIIDNQSIRILFKNGNWQGFLKISFYIQGKEAENAAYILNLPYTIDSSFPTVSVTNQIGNYPKFIQDKYIEVSFSEKVIGAENPNHYSLSGSAVGSLVIVKAVKITDTLYRLAILGSPNPSFSTLNFSFANIKDTNDNFMRVTLGYKIPVVREVSEMNVPRTFSQCIRLNESEILVIGGWQNGATSTTIEKINLNDYTSQVLGDLGTPRVFFSAIKVSDGRILIVGGLKGNDGASNRLNTAEWIQVSPFSVSNASFTLPANRYFHESILTDDENVFLFGGQSTPASKTAVTTVINPLTNVVSVGPSLSAGREGFGWLKFNSRLWIGGGEISNNLPTDSVESFSLTSPYTFVSEGKLTVARSLLRLVKVGYSVMAIGGRNGLSVPEIWNAQKTKFEPTGISDNGSHYASSILWDQDRALDIGGYLTSPVESKTIGDIRLFNSSQVSVLINTLKNARYGHCAIPISLNKILILGGSQGNTSSSNSRDTPAMEVIEYNE